MSDRNQLLEEAFGEGESTIAGLKLRPLSLGALNQCRKMKLTMFVSGDKDDELSEDETMRQVVSLLWLLSQPLLQVLAAIREDRWREAVELFEFTIHVESIPDVLREINRFAKQANAAVVEVAPKPGSVDKDQPPNS